MVSRVTDAPLGGQDADKKCQQFELRFPLKFLINGEWCRGSLTHLWWSGC